MKLYIVICVLIYAVNGAEPVVRFPLVSETFAEKVDEYRKTATLEHFVENEVTWSNADSSSQGKHDYFVVWSSEPQGGRILRLSPMITTEEGLEYTPLFTDVLTGEEFSLELETQDNRNGSNDYDLWEGGLLQNYFHYGSLIIGSDVYHLVVAYNTSLRNPTICLAWGAESDLMGPGTIVDSFEVAVTDEAAKRTKLHIQNAQGVEGMENGIYLAMTSHKEFGQVRIEQSIDFRTWQELTIEPLLIYGDAVMYKLISRNIGFFRATEL